MSDHPIMFYSYISTKAACDPVKTFYVCAPECCAASEEELERFANSSGWKDIAEEKGAVLVMPVAPQGWQAEPPDLFMRLYAQTRNAFKTRSGSSILGSKGVLWCWETLIYLAGYEEGARFAGNALVKCPNMFAAAALVNGEPSDFSAGDEGSNHWLVPHVSEDYKKLNREIPVALWMFAKERSAAQNAIGYFASAETSCKQEKIAGLSSLVWKKPEETANLRLFEGDFATEPFLAQFIAKQLFDHVIRWKNGPDGTLAEMESKEEFYRNPRFIRHSVRENDFDYDFFVHLPTGKTTKDAAGLPLVFSVHGRGEPAWMFTTKNGWDTLADETQEFVVISPDSPGNSWIMNRDLPVFEKMIRSMEEIYHIDTTRVYFTGFSNGGVIAREIAVTQPELFAAISPWNAPGPDSITLYRVSGIPPMEFGPEFTEALEKFRNAGYELPCLYVYGDDDNKAPPAVNLTLNTFLEVNDCEKCASAVYDGQNRYTADAGYTEGDRIKLSTYRGRENVERVGCLIAKNMPHGAIFDETRAVWDFVKKFYRPKGSCRVEVLG